MSHAWKMRGYVSAAALRDGLYDPWPCFAPRDAVPGTVVIERVLIPTTRERQRYAGATEVVVVGRAERASSVRL